MDGRRLLLPCPKTDDPRRIELEQIHRELGDKLRATGDKLLVEDCTAHPRGEALYWGMTLKDCPWIREKLLGRLWMELRRKL